MAYGFTRTLTSDGSLVPTTQSNFTALFSITDNELRTVANGGEIVNTDSGRPADFAFFGEEGLTTQLKHKVISYNATTGHILGWIKVPTLNATTETILYIGYGDAAVTTYQGDDDGIYDASVLAHWELGDGSTLSANDNTANAHHGTLSNTPTATTGKIDGGANFVSASSQKITIPTGLMKHSGTWSAWCKATTLPNAYNTVFSRFQGAQATYLLIKSNGKLACEASPAVSGTCAYDGTGSETLSTGTWYRVSLSFNDLAVTAYIVGYVNGAVDKTQNASNSNDFDLQSFTTSIAGFGNAAGSYFDGIIDDVIFTDGERSADWILTEYRNQNDPEAFWTLGETSGEPPDDVAETGHLSDAAFDELIGVLSVSPLEIGELIDAAEAELVGLLATSPLLSETAEVLDEAEASLVSFLSYDVSETIEGLDTSGLFAGIQVPYAPGMVVLTHIYFDEGTEGFSSLVVDAPSHSHEGRVIMWGVAEREIPVPVGPPRIGNIRVRFADTDQYFRRKFGAKTPRMRKIDFLIGPMGGSESLFQKPHTAIIDSVTFPPGAMEIEGIEVRYNWLRNLMPALCTEENFPNIPQSSRGRFFPAIFGNVTSEGRGDQGAVELILVDPATNRYAVNRMGSKEVTVYKKEPGEEVFTIVSTGYTMTLEVQQLSGEGYFCTFVDFDSAWPDGTVIRADVQGSSERLAWGLFEPILDTLIENPIDCLINLLAMIRQVETTFVEYDYQSFKDVRDTCTALDYRAALAIVDQWTNEAALTAILSSFNIDMFPSQQDKIKVALTASIPADRDVFTDTLHLEQQSEIIQLAAPTKNQFRYKYAHLPAEGRYALEEIYNNEADQETLSSPYHDGIEVEEVELRAIADPDVALNVILERSSWMDQSSHRMRVRIGAPPNLSKIDLAKIIGITHYGGLQEGGWVNEPFKIIRVALDLANLEYTLDLIKRVAPPTPPEPQLLDIGQWRHNSRVGPWYNSATRRLFTVMADTRNGFRSLVAQMKPTANATTFEVVDDGAFLALANPIVSFDGKRFGNITHHVTQEQTTGRVAYHAFSLVTASWVILDEEVLESNSHGDCGVTIAVRSDGTVVIVFQGDREAGGPALSGSFPIAPAGDYQRAYITHRTVT